jgi:hypothetical protein
VNEEEAGNSEAENTDGSDAFWIIVIHYFPCISFLYAYFVGYALDFMCTYVCFGL